MQESLLHKNIGRVPSDTQPAFTCSKSTRDTPEQHVKSVQS